MSSDRTAARTRLDPAARREQLLQIGARLFAEQPFEEVSIEEISSLAGVSRGLMYRYFATKRDLFRAVVQEAADRLVEPTAPDSDLPLEECLTAGLDAYISAFEANAALIRAAYAGAATADEEVRAIIAAQARGHEGNILATLTSMGAVETPRLRMAVRGWVLMCRMLVLDWLDTREITREELRDLCHRSLLALVDDELGPRARTDP
ncbi:TetR/AcrR family transcriptional regulator [Streptomyces chiangmaiensis]|uniref:Helix-turn-helix domain-containing protein n=1 Tax=Streptomyces chiangmaiensis TaxID=766497 RepID=A0ABU7FTD5_9ACTN|nr:helix-turn-helix domain-containing protein [Streptomyces chiangmaiensis]MED7827337.1 helix-turn-helix domain-containing protein [Streptomyces chiangmaiensis]